MKSEKEIKDKIEELENNFRRVINLNKPLEKTKIISQITTLKWVLNK